MKALTRKITVSTLLLFLICTQLSSNQISLKLHENFRLTAKWAEFCCQENLMTRIAVQPLEESELLVEENSQQQYTESNSIHKILWNISEAYRQRKDFFLQVSAFLLFADIICDLLRFMIAYRYKQDGKKQNNRLAFNV